MQVALREARELRTAWRRRYNLPPNDPRVLEATDEEILDWLLVDALADEDETAATDPRAALERAVRENPAGVQRWLDAVSAAPLPGARAPVAPAPLAGGRAPRKPVRP